MQQPFPLAAAAILFLVNPPAFSGEEENRPATSAEAEAKENTTNEEPDFGDSSSATLARGAWAAFGAGKHPEAQAYARKCIGMYQSQALEMQKGDPATDHEEIHAKWALNDVGVCYYILGQSLEAEGKKEEALTAYRFLTGNLSHAQCWDEQGWFWKPAEAARERAKTLQPTPE